MSDTEAGEYIEFSDVGPARVTKRIHLAAYETWREAVKVLWPNENLDWDHELALAESDTAEDMQKRARQAVDYLSETGLMTTLGAACAAVTWENAVAGLREALETL